MSIEYPYQWLNKTLKYFTIIGLYNLLYNKLLLKLTEIVLRTFKIRLRKLFLVNQFYSIQEFEDPGN